jgi:macrolide phosphotransferase
VPLSFEGASRLVHNDLWAEHILVDLRSGYVSGIIDWGDAAISDPAIDFAGLYTWYGESWLESVLESYPGTLDSEVISRARYLATCLAIHNITLGQDLGRPQWIKAGQEALRLVFST